MGTWWPAVTAAAVVVVTTLVGLFTNWSGNRPRVIGTPVRFWTAFAGAVAVAVGLAVVQGTVPRSVPADSATASWHSTGPSGPSGSSAPSAQLFLDELPVDLGTGNLRHDLPPALAGQPGYPHPLVVACASGQATDQFREVRYALVKRYLSVSATVEAYEPTPDESLLQVLFFRDGRSPVDRTVRVGTSTVLTVDLTGVDNLVIRVICQAPTATAILVNARLRHA